MSIEIFDETKSVLHIHAEEKFKVFKFQLIIIHISHIYGLAQNMSTLKLLNFGNYFRIFQGGFLKFSSGIMFLYY